MQTLPQPTAARPAVSSYRQMLERVRYEGVYPTRERAEEVVRTVLGALGRQVTGEERVALAACLPRPAARIFTAQPPENECLTGWAFVRTSPPAPARPWPPPAGTWGPSSPPSPMWPDPTSPTGSCAGSRRATPCSSAAPNSRKPPRREPAAGAEPGPARPPVGSGTVQRPGAGWAAPRLPALVPGRTPGRGLCAVPHGAGAVPQSRLLVHSRTRAPTPYRTTGPGVVLHRGGPVPCRSPGCWVISDPGRRRRAAPPGPELSCTAVGPCRAALRCAGAVPHCGRPCPAAPRDTLPHRSAPVSTAPWARIAHVRAAAERAHPGKRRLCCRRLPSRPCAGGREEPHAADGWRCGRGGRAPRGRVPGRLSRTAAGRTEPPRRPGRVARRPRGGARRRRGGTAAHGDGKGVAMARRRRCGPGAGRIPRRRAGGHRAPHRSLRRGASICWTSPRRCSASWWSAVCRRRWRCRGHGCR